MKTPPTTTSSIDEVKKKHLDLWVKILNKGKNHLYFYELKPLIKGIDALFESELRRVEANAKEVAYANVGSWHKLPFRKGLLTKTIKGLGILKGGGCEVCGGKLVVIRGRHPGENKRKICPTCAFEILESIMDSCNNRQTCSSQLTDPKQKEKEKNK